MASAPGHDQPYLGTAPTDDHDQSQPESTNGPNVNVGDVPQNRPNPSMNDRVAESHPFDDPPPMTAHATMTAAGGSSYAMGQQALNDPVFNTHVPRNHYTSYPSMRTTATNNRMAALHANLAWVSGFPVQIAPVQGTQGPSNPMMLNQNVRVTLSSYRLFLTWNAQLMVPQYQPHTQLTPLGFDHHNLPPFEVATTDFAPSTFSVLRVKNVSFPHRSAHPIPSHLHLSVIIRLGADSEVSEI